MSIVHIKNKYLRRTALIALLPFAIVGCLTREICHLLVEIACVVPSEIKEVWRGK